MVFYVFLNECLFYSFGGHFGLLSRHQQGVHFGSQSHELQGGSTITLIFKFLQNFGVLGIVQSLKCIVCAVFWIGTGVQSRQRKSACLCTRHQSLCDSKNCQCR